MSKRMKFCLRATIAIFFLWTLLFTSLCTHASKEENKNPKTIHLQPNYDENTLAQNIPQILPPLTKSHMANDEEKNKERKREKIKRKKQKQKERKNEKEEQMNKKDEQIDDAIVNLSSSEEIQQTVYLSQNPSNVKGLERPVKLSQNSLLLASKKKIVFL